jgi:hypothetical protein
MKIRKEQMAVLDRAALKAFEDELVRHLRDFDPKHTAALGEDGLRQVIRSGMERAAKYGLTNRGPIRFYIELMFLFGSDFDTDPWLPWARACLTDPTTTDQMDRAQQLYEAMTTYLDEVAGPENAYAIEALRRLDRARPEDFPVASPDFEEIALRGLNEIHPQWCASLGEVAVRALIGRGMELARQYAAFNDQGVALFIASLFILGHGFDHDPIFPWISEALNDSRETDPSRRIERLQTRMKACLGEVLADLGER